MLGYGIYENRKKAVVVDYLGDDFISFIAKYADYTRQQYFAQVCLWARQMVRIAIYILNLVYILPFHFLNRSMR